jgi:TPR repeat protein
VNRIALAAVALLAGPSTGFAQQGAAGAGPEAPAAAATGPIGGDDALRPALTSESPGQAGDLFIAPTESLAPQPAGIAPDASLADPTARTLLRTPLDANDIGQRIDKGLTAAGERSAFPPDYAYGAFQRGYFLTAFSLALDRAKAGDAAAQTLLGELLSRGLGIKQDLAAAADWYRLAGEHGDPEALYALGRAYLEGRGVAPDDRRAADLLDQAAQKGHSVAAREFAYMLLQGKGRDKNPMLAAAMLRRAARAGDMDAQYALAGLFTEGVGVVADDAQAARWYGAAAASGHIGAQIEYAIMLFNGRGLAKDERAAAAWFREAAQADNPLAQARYARLLMEGRGVPANPGDAARWYLIARNRGFRDNVLETWYNQLDAGTRKLASEAAERWTRLKGVPMRAAEDAAESAYPAPPAAKAPGSAAATANVDNPTK